MKTTICLLAVATSCVSLLGFSHSTYAEDLTVEWVTVTPSEVQAGDSETLEGRIANYGPGMALAVQYRWYLSTDAQITTDDMILGPEGTLYEILYEGSGTIVSQPFTVPAFPDPAAPSYFGLILDPYEWILDGDRSNNADSAAFTFTADPPHDLYDTMGDNYLDAIHVTAVLSGGNLNVAITFSQPPPGTVSALMGIDLDQDPTTTGNNTTLPGTEAMVSLLYQLYDSVVTLENDSGSHTLGDAVLNDNILTYSIPLSLLNNDTTMDLFWAIDHAVGPTADFDQAPDTGAFATDTESVKTVHQFATPSQSNRLYLTLPLESIGSPTGSVDILVRTASWGGGSGILLPNDDLPSSEVVTLATVPGDLDADSDVDYRDLALFASNPTIMTLGKFSEDFGFNAAE